MPIVQTGTIRDTGTGAVDGPPAESTVHADWPAPAEVSEAASVSDASVTTDGEAAPTEGGVVQPQASTEAATDSAAADTKAVQSDEAENKAVKRTTRASKKGA